MKKIFDNSLKLAVFLLILMLLGCDEDDGEGNSPKVTAGFTYLTEENTGTVTFMNVSENAISYRWNFGNGTISTEINPIQTYTGSGTYTVTLTAKNSDNATSTFTDNVIVPVKVFVKLPIIFDDAIGYTANTLEGASFKIADNIHLSGTNSKMSKVGAMTTDNKSSGGVIFDLSTPLDLTTKKSITMNLWTNALAKVTLKLGQGVTTEKTAIHSGRGWERIKFDFNTGERYSRLTLLVDSSEAMPGAFYIDDIIQE